MKLRKCCRLAFLLLTVFTSIKLLGYFAAWIAAKGFGGISFSVSQASTIGVIGGADGPTAIFVTSAPVPGWQLVLTVVLLIAGISGLIKLKKK